MFISSMMLGPVWLVVLSMNYDISYGIYLVLTVIICRIGPVWSIIFFMNYDMCCGIYLVLSICLIF